MASPNNRFNAASTAEQVTEGLDLRHVTAVVTGCSAGIGYETMRVLVARGAHVLGIARTLEKARQACVAAVAQAPGNGRATPFACDQSDFAAVKSCAQDICKLGVPLDILICNAGIAFLAKLTQTRGIEEHFVVNHLSHFVLVHHLLAQVTAARQGRVVVLGSDAYKFAPNGIEFDNLSGERDYDPIRMYAQSKLANGLFALELAQRVAQTSATVNTLHPGVIETNIFKHFAPDQRPQAGKPYGPYFVKDIPQGAATTCYVATEPSLGQTNGEYFEDCHKVVPEPVMRDRVMAVRLWDVSTELTKAYL